ncbi:cytochrome P450 2C31-like [Hemicordylus capensis]|uniref:cytochrome P450 2C31-like n=1 Tax=Hemicordylus capensis TaxID=884348 RepID=UPI0023037D37|nr:cytochrome P450 2C31-like [Hemicordylus capensis]
MQVLAGTDKLINHKNFLSEEKKVYEITVSLCSQGPAPSRACSLALLGEPPAERCSTSAQKLPKGLVNKDDAKWKDLHRFTLSTLQNFGMGKKPMAERIQEEAHCLVEAMATAQGQAFDAMPDITAAVSNVVCSVVFGDRFSYEDPDFIEILRITKDFVGFFMCVSGVVYSAIPRIMNHLPGPHNKLFADSAKICAFIREKVESHKLALDPQNPGDFIDCFLLKLQKEKNSTTKICTEDLVMTVVHLFLAGTETTSSNLIYGLVLLAKFPHIQAKAQQEIDEVVGTNRAPGMGDRVRMPYTNAVVHEIQRSQRGSGETFPHETTQDVNFRSYKIPKGTIVLPLFVSVHYDPVYWETPDKFDPGHFLDEKGEFRKREAFLPFSAGKRACPGEALAQMELFLFFSTLLQKYSFQLVVNSEKMDIASIFMACREEGPHRQLRAIRCKI